MGPVFFHSFFPFTIFIFWGGKKVKNNNNILKINNNFAQKHLTRFHCCNRCSFPLPRLSPCSVSES